MKIFHLLQEVSEKYSEYGKWQEKNNILIDIII